MKVISFILLFFVLFVDMPFCQVIKSCKVIDVAHLYSNYYVYSMVEKNRDTLHAFSYCKVTSRRINELPKVQENETYDFLLLELPVGFKLELRPYEDAIIFLINGKEISRGNFLLSKCYFILNTECDLINELKLPDEN